MGPETIGDRPLDPGQVPQFTAGNQRLQPSIYLDMP